LLYCSLLNMNFLRSKLKSKSKIKWEPDNHFPNIYESIEDKRKQFILNLPDIEICELDVLHHRQTVSGPHDITEPDDNYKDWMYGKSISTYPRLEGTQVGDPIADSYLIEMYKQNIVIGAVADGCNWGTAQRDASMAAKKNFAEYLRNHIADMKTIRDCGHFVLQAISYVQYKMLEGKVSADEIFSAATTTFLGGILVPLEPSPSRSTPYVWIFASIGDCKVYHYSTYTRTTTDLLEPNIENFPNFEAKDPGGRLGPYQNNGEPDLRNLYLGYCLCSAGDLIILLSDGVADNLRPDIQGKLPAEVKPAWEGAASWEALSSTTSTKEIEQELSRSAVKCLNEMIINHGTPQEITNLLLKHANDVTEEIRTWMEQNRGNATVAAYHGKMDHTTCAVFKVGKQREWSVVKPLLAAVMKNQPPECKIRMLSKDVMMLIIMYV